MLITKRKPIEQLPEVSPLLVLKCFGCREAGFPEAAIDGYLAERKDHFSGIARYDYLCREEFSRVYVERHREAIDRSAGILVFSCGVGVQVLAALRPDKPVYAGCDTVSLAGFQGLTPQADDCDQCGECWLTLTGGICPLTACSKFLLNGQCGGAKNGKCEVTPTMECGWERIFRRLEGLGVPREAASRTHVRDFRKLITDALKTKE